MKRILLILLCLLPSLLYGTDYYIATDGNDEAAGDIDHPWLTWEKINGNVSAGDIVYIRGGTYRSTYGNSATTHVRWANFTGTSSDTIKIWAYPGESPVLDLDNISVTSGYCFGFYISNCSYIHIKGLRVTGLKQPSSGAPIWGMFFDHFDHGVIENCVVDNTMYGFAWGDGADILVKNCDAHNLEDPYTGYGGSNGFDITGGSTTTNVIFEGCRAWFVCDDGFDFYIGDGIITLKNCWSFWNGYDDEFNHTGDGNGYKLGRPNDDLSTVTKTLTNCLAVHNYFNGFSQNTVEYYNPQILYNNLSYNNGSYGYEYGWGPAGGTPSIFRNNISYGDDVGTLDKETVDTDDHNSWNGFTVTDDDFVSLDETQLDNARQADGSLPVITFGTLVEGSDLIDVGIYVGMPFQGNNPDIGYAEYVDPPAPAGTVFGKHRGVFGKHRGKLVKINR